MKTLRTILMGVIALAAILAAVTFLLPAKMTLERSADIGRPPSLVYAFVSDLNAFNQVSPWRAADPNMSQTFTGQSGQGQKMSWSSTKMGKGSMLISEAKPYERVAYDLDFGRGKAKSWFKIEPTPKGSKVTWGMDSIAGLNPIERVMNLVMKGVIARDYDAGLVRLRILAEELPNVDLNGLSVSTVDVNPRPFIYVPVVTPSTDPALAEAEILRAMNKANAVLILNDMSPSGPGVIQFTDRSNGQIRANAGFPIDKAPTQEEAAALVGSAKVVFGELPGGKMLRAPSAPHSGEKTFQQLQIYLKLMRLQARGDAQQAYPAGPQGETDVFVPIG